MWRRHGDQALRFHSHCGKKVFHEFQVPHPKEKDNMESCFFLTRRGCKKLSSSNALLSTYLEFFLLSNLRQRLWNSSSLTSLENFLKTSCTKKVALNCFLSLMSTAGCQRKRGRLCFGSWVIESKSIWRGQTANCSCSHFVLIPHILLLGKFLSLRAPSKKLHSCK